MDLLAPLIAYSVALSIAAVIPGPGVAGLVGQSLGNGLQVSLYFLAGIALGDVVYLTIAIAGLAAIAQLFSGALLAIKVLGGLYLVYLASKFWRNEAGPHPCAQGRQPPRAENVPVRLCADAGQSQNDHFLSCPAAHGH